MAAASGLTTPQLISTYAQAMLGESLLLAGDATAALRPLRKTLAQREQLLPDDHPVRLNSMSMVGAAEVATGDREHGLPRMEDAAARLRAGLGPDHEFTRRALARIDRHAPAAGRQRTVIGCYGTRAACAVIHARVSRSSTSSGTEPSASSASWKARMSKSAPSTCSASARSSRMRIMPIM